MKGEGTVGHVRGLRDVDITMLLVISPHREKYCLLGRKPFVKKLLKYVSLSSSRVYVAFVMKYVCLETSNYYPYVDLGHLQTR